jgi:hypothetical protein
VLDRNIHGNPPSIGFYMRIQESEYRRQNKNSLLAILTPGF